MYRLRLWLDNFTLLGYFYSYGSFYISVRVLGVRFYIMTCDGFIILSDT